jgi:hypothetical protein
MSKQIPTYKKIGDYIFASSHFWGHNLWDISRIMSTLTWLVFIVNGILDSSQDCNRNGQFCFIAGCLLLIFGTGVPILRFWYVANISQKISSLDKDPELRDSKHSVSSKKML